MLNTELLNDQLYLKQLKAGIQTDIYIPVLTADPQKPKCVNNNLSAHQEKNGQRKYYSARKNGIWVHATTWLDLKNILSEVGQKQKYKYCILPFTLVPYNRQVQSRIQ